MPKKEHKTFDFEIKELSEEGRFSGYLSTFGNVDQGGDVVDAGAFKKTLKETKAFPLTWAHQTSTPDLVIGSFEAKEDEKGLFMNGEFYLDQDGGLKAYKLVKKFFEKGIKVGLSMGYKTIKDAIETVAGGFIRHLKEVKLREGAVALFPMNLNARITQLKEDSDEGDDPQDKNDENLGKVCPTCGKALDGKPDDKSTSDEPPELTPEEIHSVLKGIADRFKIKS